MDQEKEVNKKFIVSLTEVNQVRGKGKLSNLEGCTVKYGPQN